MNEMSSTEFRKRYAKLTEETHVTANGHLVGTWFPRRLTEVELPVDPATGDVVIPWKVAIDRLMDSPDPGDRFTPAPKKAGG